MVHRVDSYFFWTYACVPCLNAWFSAVCVEWNPRIRGTGVETRQCRTTGHATHVGDPRTPSRCIATGSVGSAPMRREPIRPVVQFLRRADVVFNLRLIRGHSPLSASQAMLEAVPVHPEGSLILEVFAGGEKHHSGVFGDIRDIGVRKLVTNEH